jgi:signal peptide peptidase SppA
MHQLLRAEFYATPWAIQPAAYAVMCEVLERWAAGMRLSAEEIRAAVGEAPEVVAARRAAAARAGQGVIAVLPVYGILTQRGNMMSNVSGPGGTSVALLTQAFKSAVADPSVSAIVMDVDSPGGSVFGIGELADEIQGARGAKPIVAVANSVAASAAYWIAAAADQVVVTPGGEVGSIGVVTEHKDTTKADASAGVARTVISAGKYKAEGWSGPLTAEAQAALQERVDAYYETMVKSIARGRDVTQKAVREGFGEGRTLGAARAQKEGLVDRIATLDQVLGELMAKRAGARATAKASAAELRERDL